MSLRSIGGELSLLHLVAAVCAAAAGAESAVVVKGFPRAHPVTTNAVGMTAERCCSGPAPVLTSEQWTVPHLARTWAALSWLVIAGSVGLFYLFVFVIGRWTASATAYSLTLMPVVAVTLAALLADEPITPEVVVGAALVVVAVYVGAIRRTATSSPDGIRTRATALRGRRASRYTTGARSDETSRWSTLPAGVPGLEPRLTEPESVVLPITPYPNGSDTEGARSRSQDSASRKLRPGRSVGGQQLDGGVERASVGSRPSRCSRLERR